MEHFYQNIEGWFDFQNFYSKLVAEHNDGAHFVEVGVWKGKSLSYLAVEIINSGKKIRLDAVDTWEGSPLEHTHYNHPDVINKTLYERFLESTESIRGAFNIVRSDSVAAADLYENESLDVVYIDASHHYDFVKADILAWLPKVKRGGLLCGHDYVAPRGLAHENYDVHTVVNELFPNDFEITDGVTWVHKKK